MACVNTRARIPKSGGDQPSIWRPSLRRHTGRELRLAALAGLTLALMNLSFYEAIDGLVVIASAGAMLGTRGPAPVDA
jgi:hypothetical protein